MVWTELEVETEDELVKAESIEEGVVGAASGVVVAEGAEARGVVPGSIIDEDVVADGVPAGGVPAGGAELEVVAGYESITDGTGAAAIQC